MRLAELLRTIDKSFSFAVQSRRAEMLSLSST